MGLNKELDGFLVVALEQAVAAPYCSLLLADAGARVIKLERPEGDFCRNYDRAADGQSTWFGWLNRGKQSVVVDYAKDEDAALLRALIAKADVFCTTFHRMLWRGTGFRRRICVRLTRA